MEEERERVIEPSPTPSGSFYHFWYRVNFQTEGLTVGCTALLSCKVHFSCPLNPLDCELVYMCHKLNRPWAL